jgi:hypothetical protein
MYMLILILVLFVSAIVAPWVIPNKKVSDNEWDRKY